MSTPPFLQNFVRQLWRALFAALLAVSALVGLYLAFTYNFAYSRGESVGFVQKLSYKGWVCKTWEGEQMRAVATMPAVPEKFSFTVRDDAVVDKINAHLGKKVVLEYAQHRGLPSCFGDTEHFVVDVRPAPEE